MSFLQHVWVRTGVPTLLLLPLTMVFAAGSALRRLAYRYGWLRTVSVGVPVIVVGNITAGGSGKTPFVIWLANWLRGEGYRPGVISRGYGGTARGCVEVRADSPPALVGDEPVLIRLKTEVPVVIGRDRAAAAHMLRAHHPDVDVIVSDDGLQHYRLHRDIELAVVDAATGLGNGWLLPSGPLREPASRLRSVDAVIQVVRGTVQPRALGSVASWRADFSSARAYRLNAPQERRMMRDLPPRDWLAVTGIGQPQGFFSMLDAHGLRYRPCAFPDHHVFRPTDISLGEAVLMTEKDAVKCRQFAGSDWWVVELDVVPDHGFVRWLDARLKQYQGRVCASEGRVYGN